PSRARRASLLRAQVRLPDLLALAPHTPPHDPPFPTRRSSDLHYRLDDRLTAIVDIGGGSAEVILSAGGVIEQLHSLPLGAVRLRAEEHTSELQSPDHLVYGRLPEKKQRHRSRWRTLGGGDPRS